MRQISIGRSKDNDITIDNDSVSRHHATIIQTSSGIVINDNGSNNGTFINGNRINQESALRKNDILKLGSALIPWMNYVVTKFVITSFLVIHRTAVSLSSLYAASSPALSSS